jgi:hypothetical protein
MKNSGIRLVATIGLIAIILGAVLPALSTFN